MPIFSLVSPHGAKLFLYKMVDHPGWDAPTASYSTFPSTRILDTRKCQEDQQPLAEDLVPMLPKYVLVRELGGIIAYTIL